MILDSPIISGSLTQQAGQTAEIPRYTAVSSSFLAASASFDARIDSIESTTASLSPRINALESFTASANATYVNVSGDSMSGDLTITGSLIVTDRITAQEFHTEYVSSSVVFQSGSTTFGNSGDDVHSFTGSVQIDGDVIASNLEGVFSSSAQITGSLGNYYIVSGTITQTTWDNIENKPLGIVSGSDQLTASLDSHYIVSGTITQTTWDNIALKPDGIVSGAAQVTESLDVRYRLIGDDITFAELTFKPTLISGSSQLDGTTIQNLSGSFSGSFSGSYRGDGSSLTGLAAGAKFHTQSEAASTWTFIHNLSTQYPNVTVYGSNDTIILPQSITATNADTLVLEFGTPVAGYATAGIGGIIEVNGRTIKQYFESSLEWRFEHNFGDRFANIQTYDSNYEKIIPQTIVLTDATSSLITFPEVTEGWAIGTIGGDLPSISSSYGGYVLQVSDSAPYTASWTPAANVTVTTALTASYLNSFSQSLIPAVSGAYDLGSIDKPFRHIYVGTGSIYLVTPEGDVSNTISADTIVTTDTLSSGSINLVNSLPAGTVSGSSQIVEILNPLNSYTQSNDTLNTTQNTRLNSLEEKTGSLATTGSNTFIGTQTITGSLYISSDLIVQGSSSLQNITASAVSIGTNIVNLNTANPSIRYAGLVIGDSGSIGSSGSFLYDSVQDEMIFVHRGANSTVTSSVVLMGPQTYDNIGSETYLTNNRLVKGAGNEHLSDSNISDTGTLVTINSATSSFSGLVGIGITNPSYKLDVNGQIYSKGYIVNGDYAAISGVPNAGIYGTDSSFADGYNSLIVASRTDAARPIIFATYNGSSFAERMRITGPGLVGINESSPATIGSGYGALTIGGSSGGGINLKINGNASSPGQIWANSTDMVFKTNDSKPFTFYTDSTMALRIASGGNIGVGTTNPAGRFNVVSPGADGIILSADINDANNSGRLFFMRTGGEGWVIMNNGGNLSFRNNSVPGSTSGSERMRLDSSYNLTLNNGLNVAGLVGIGKSDQSGNAVLTLKSPAGGNTGIILIEGDTTNDGWGVYAVTADEYRITRFTNGSYSDKMVITSAGHTLPGADASYNLGSTTYRWNNVYTTDLHLSNEGSQNSVDGTWGDWTLQEGENDIFMLNNRSGEKFKIKLEKIV